MEIVRSYRKPLERQTAEEYLIAKQEGTTMNRKGEWGQNLPPKFTIEDMGAQTAPNRKKAPQIKRKSAKDSQKEKGNRKVQEENTVHVHTVQRENAVHIHTVQQETDIHTDAQPAEKKRRCTVNPPQISTMDEALTMIEQRDPIDYGPGFSQVSLVSEKQNGQNAKNSPIRSRKGGIENHKSPQIE